MNQASLRSNLRHLCCLALPSETLMPQLLPLVRALVPADSAGFFWVDANGHMNNLIAERMLSIPKMQLYFDHFYSGGKYDFRKNFLARAAQPEVVATTEADSSFRESAYYNEILKDLDAHHVLYGVVRDRGTALGQLSLYRSKYQKPFSVADQHQLTELMHYITHAVAAPTSADGRGFDFVDSVDDAVIMVAHDGTIVNASDQGRRLVVQAAGGSFAPDFDGAENESVRAVLREAISLLGREQLPHLSLVTRWGRMQVRAYELGNGGDAQSRDAVIAVRVTRQEPLILKFARALRTLNLPPQQQEIAMYLARGMSNSEIAEQIGIRPNTVTYHIKQLFVRLQAHGRAEIIERVIGGE